MIINFLIVIYINYWPFVTYIEPIWAKKNLKTRNSYSLDTQTKNEKTQTTEKEASRLLVLPENTLKNSAIRKLRYLTFFSSRIPRNVPLKEVQKLWKVAHKKNSKITRQIGFQSHYILIQGLEKFKTFHNKLLCN